MLSRLGLNHDEIGLLNIFMSGRTTTSKCPKEITYYNFGSIYTPPSDIQCSTTNDGQYIGSIFNLQENTPPYKIIGEPYKERSKHNYLGNTPLDCIPGDTGHVNYLGYYMGLLTGGPIMLRANPMCCVELFDIGNLVRVNSINFVHNTKIGEMIINEEYKEEKLDDTYVQRKTNKEFYTVYKDNYRKHVTSNGLELKVGKEIVTTIGVNKEPVLPEKPFDWKDTRHPQEKEYLKHLTNDEPTSAIHQREDGSIILMSKSGSSIELTKDGDILIYAKKDIKFVSDAGIYTMCDKKVDKVKTSVETKTKDIKIQSETETNECTEKTHTTNKLTEKVSDRNSYDVKLSYKCGTKTEEIDTNNSKVNYSNIVYNTNNTYSSSQNITSDVIQMKTSSQFLMDVPYLRWHGNNFGFYAKGYSVITSLQDVYLKHSHWDGKDNFFYSYCGKGVCKLTKILSKETDTIEDSKVKVQTKPLIQIATQSINKINDISIEVDKPLWDSTILRDLNIIQKE